MHLTPTPRPPRKTLLHHAITGMTAIDITTNTYRTTTNPTTKHLWTETTLNHPLYQPHTNPHHPIIFTHTGTNTWNHYHNHNTTTITLGPKPMTDLDLALMTAQITRMTGAPTNTRQATGKIHDRATIMLTTLAIATHDTERAQQFHHFCNALKLTTTTPPEGWPWENQP